MAGFVHVDLVPVGGDEGVGSYMGCFRDVLYNHMNVTCHVVV